MVQSVRVDARKDFLHAYDKVAKPITRGLLGALGRDNEFSLFFKDVAVNEDGKKAKPETPTTTPEPAKEGG